MNVFDRRYEQMPRGELRQLQLERLQALLVRLRKNVRRHRERLASVSASSLDDISKVPFTTPEDLADSFPFAMFALPLREVIRLQSTVGPAGRPLVIGHTRNDLTQWARLAARQLAASGVTANDVIQVSLGSQTAAAAAGFVLGAQLIEASVIAEDPRHIDYQFAMIQNYRPTVLITTPTNALELVRTSEARGMDPQSLHLRTVLLSRPVPAEIREQLATGLFASVQCSFGIAEVLDPGLCVECDAGCFHIHEDQFLPEICDGELVVTTLAREAMPLLRYRTRIGAALRFDKCPCGRTGAIVDAGRPLDGRFRVSETTLYEEQIAQVLRQTRATGHRFRIETGDRCMRVAVEMTESLFANTVATSGDPKREIESELLARLGVEAEVRFVEPQVFQDTAAGPAGHAGRPPAAGV